MHVVRIATSGTASRMSATLSRMVRLRSGRRMRFSTSSAPCWMGMSKYGSSRFSEATSSRSAGVIPAL